MQSDVAPTVPALNVYAVGNLTGLFDGFVGVGVVVGASVVVGSTARTDRRSPSRTGPPASVWVSPRKTTSAGGAGGRGATHAASRVRAARPLPTAWS